MKKDQLKMGMGEIVWGTQHSVPIYEDTGMYGIQYWGDGTPSGCINVSPAIRPPRPYSKIYEGT